MDFFLFDRIAYLDESISQCVELIYDFSVFIFFYLSKLVFAEGYIYAHWTVPDSNGRVLISVPLNGMKKPIVAPLVLSTPAVPWPQN
jgi:hypothetical protein